jgi:tetratricopeptide (TPR) repeat protein
MLTKRLKHPFYCLLFLCGIACVVFAFQQQRYAHFLAEGKRAVLERRFDSQDYTRARHIWFANQDTLLFNQGVLAYTAGNLAQATDSFQQVSHQARSDALQMQALYNLGVLLLQLQEAKGAVELLKEALRLDPHDTDAKVVLERLYHTLQPQDGTRQAATGEPDSSLKPDKKGALQQAPGLGQGDPEAGQGRSAPRPGI